MIKSCELCNCNNNGFCSYKEEKLDREQSSSCRGYRDKQSVELTTRQYDLIFRCIMKTISEQEALMDNELVTTQAKKLLSQTIKDLDAIADIIGPLSV